MSEYQVPPPPHPPLPSSIVCLASHKANPPKSSDILFLAHYKVPAVATLPASAPASLTKVTFNHPDARAGSSFDGKYRVHKRNIVCAHFPMWFQISVHLIRHQWTMGISFFLYSLRLKFSAPTYAQVWLYETMICGDKYSSGGLSRCTNRIKWGFGGEVHVYRICMLKYWGAISGCVCTHEHIFTHTHTHS